MARISLRAYNRDIEAMIDGNQIDEAFAHCRHILESYPKHIVTYRLMGKALLEAQRFSDASDVFHRVLSSVPDDFIAHLGMSIIREDESNLDAAIWHMERSFEVQPSNAAVQVELRRLYGLRDGLTPQKIQLTRGALARMSAKSNLFTQAIAELRTALSNDPQRPDLQVVLAEMYAQTGARMEAIETCNSLINKLPYCLVANRILADILPETERAEKAQEYKDRLAELDPYYSHISPVAETVDQIPDGAVTIQRLDYYAESPEVIEPAQPAWATSLGVNLDEELDIEDKSPDWLGEEVEDTSTPMGLEPEEALEPDTEPPVEDESTMMSPEEMEAEPIPEWVSEPEQLESRDTLEQQPTEMEEDALEMSLEESPADSTEPEELPDWMNDVEKPVEDDTPDWLREVMEEQSEESAPIKEGAAVIGAAALLSDDDQEPLEDSMEFSEEVSMVEDMAGEENEEVGLEIEGDQDEADLPSGEAVIGEPGISAGLVAGTAAAGAAIEASEDEEEVVDSKLPQEESIDEIDEEIPDWLMDLGEDVPTSSEEPAIEDEPEEEEEIIIPESAPEEDYGEPEIIHPIEDQPLDIEVTPEIASGFTTDEQAVEEAFPESLPDWLSEVSPEGVPDHVITEDALGEEQLDIVQAKIPEWLRKMEQEHKAELAAAGETETLEAFEFDSDFTELGGEDVPTWLMTAMEAEEIGKIDEISAVEDIDEIFIVPTEEPLPKEIVETEMIAEEAIPEQLEVETISEDIVTEEAPSLKDEEELFAETVEDVADISGLAAAGVILEEAVEEGDTQPIVVAEEAKLAEVEIEQEELEVFPSIISEDDEIEPAPLPDAERLTEEDKDAAMAWLESLAAKQGVAEDELLTSPEERTEVPPEWVQEAALEDEDLEEPETDEGKIEAAAAATLASALISEVKEDEEEEIIPPAAPSEWVPEVTKEPEISMEPSVEEVFPETRDELATAEVSAEKIESETEIVPSIVDEEAEEIVSQEKELEPPSEDIPEWLTGVVEEEEQDIEAMLAEEEAETEAIETQPEVKIDLNAASLAQLEKIPGIGFIHAQRIINFRAEHGPFKELNALEKVPGLTSEMVDDLHNYLSVEVVTEIIPAVSTHPELQEAWNSINEGNIDAAVDQYAQVINRDEHLDEIIQDLQEALGRFPQDAALYQSLGDAYLHANMLQEALDAYNRAEDLIN